MVFTLDKTIISHYFRAACEADTRIIAVDDITKLPDDFDRIIDLVVCDAKFSGKVELLKMVETCNRSKVPYLMINCGTMEYQLSDIYENSAANFKQLPDYSKLIHHAVSRVQQQVIS